VGEEPVDMFVSSSFDLKVGLALNDPERSFFSIQFPKYHTLDGDPRLHGVQLVAPASFENRDNWQTGPELIRGEEYSKLKEAFVQKLLDRTEEHVPGLKEHIVSLDLATPVTMYRYTLNTAGAPVGWSYTSRRRWRQRIPFVKGLYGAGHWYGPSGIYNVTLSGKNAATLILREA
jgi:phytoene dehydrogenase-like protein